MKGALDIQFFLIDVLEDNMIPFMEVIAAGTTSAPGILVSLQKPHPKVLEQVQLGIDLVGHIPISIPAKHHG